MEKWLTFLLLLNSIQKATGVFSYHDHFFFRFELQRKTDIGWIKTNLNKSVRDLFFPLD